jgi:galactose mutarotase-like enzyme
MKGERSGSAIRRFILGRALHAVRLDSPSLTADVLVDQGGDILNLVHKATGVDLLWKVPYPVREPGVGPTPAGDSYQQWMHYYPGGWQTIFPNYGPAVSWRGALLDFHGEAARRPWVIASEVEESRAEIELSTHLASLPFSLRRHIVLSPEQPVLRVTETVTNLFDGPLDCMWAHHPVFGAPLLSSESRIYTGARRVRPDPLYDVSGNDLTLGGKFSWPLAESKAGASVDLSRIPAHGSGHSRVVFLSDFEQPWCALVNPSIPLGVALRWNADLMKHLCVWQETGGERNFPHFGRSYTTALEPSVTLFGHGLTDAVENTRTQLTLAGGESRTLHLQLTVFEDRRPVSGVGEDGELEFAS